MSEHGPADVHANRMSWEDILFAASPALLYAALSGAGNTLLASIWPGMSKIMLQGASLAVCLVYFGWRAVRENVPFTGKKATIYRYPASFCYAVSVVMCGVACNDLICLTGLKDSSSGYRHVSEVFYGNGLVMEIAALCVLSPLVEELVYRGFVFRRLLRKGNAAAAVIWSALLFGMLHLNVVQGIYGFILGVLLAYIVYRTDSILTAAAAHMASNLTSVFWTETDWLEFLNQDGLGMYAAIVLCVVLTGVFLGYGNRMMKY